MMKRAYLNREQALAMEHWRKGMSCYPHNFSG
jgi:hypothetical protein